MSTPYRMLSTTLCHDDQLRNPDKSEDLGNKRLQAWIHVLAIHASPIQRLYGKLLGHALFNTRGGCYLKAEMNYSLVQERRRAQRFLRPRRPLPCRLAEDLVHLVGLVPVGRRVLVHGILHPSGESGNTTTTAVSEIIRASCIRA